jgi:hypothetical protein
MMLHALPSAAMHGFRNALAFLAAKSAAQDTVRNISSGQGKLVSVDLALPPLSHLAKDAAK